MKAIELFDKLKNDFDLKTDSDLAKLLGLTSGRLSQLRKSNSKLSTRQVVGMLKRTATFAKKKALRSAIRPIVELYPIRRTSSRQEKKWEIISSDKGKHSKESSLRKYLEKARGIYFYYDSGGKILYTGKTEKQTLWKEMNGAFNRERQTNKVYLVKHPSTGKTFTPAWKKLRQPKNEVVFLHDIAQFFSVYEVAPEIISNLEAMIIRALCNNLSNVKMEKIGFKHKSLSMDASLK
jgi:hypothetical protein